MSVLWIVPVGLLLLALVLHLVGVILEGCSNALCTFIVALPRYIKNPKKLINLLW